MNLGHNTGSAAELRAFIERLERLDEERRDLGEQRKAVVAEMKANGFDSKTVSAIIKIRKAKPHDLQEANALLDTYLHALGMSVEPPLLRFMSNAADDVLSLEAMVAHMSPAVPPFGQGHIDIKLGADTWRLSRDAIGDVVRNQVADAPPPRPAAEPTARQQVKRDVPAVDEAGAEALGRQFARENRAVIENPFPFGDARRARFDEGWRRESGGDGMGPDDRGDA